jgi:hypothetical protein
MDLLLRPHHYLVVRSLIAGGLSTPFRDASAGVMVLFAVVHLDWLDEHKLAGQVLPTDDECVLATLRGIRRSHGTAPLRKVPATVEKIIAMAPTGRGRLSDIRDRALLLIGFGGAFRRSELVALDVTDIEEAVGGVLINIRHSKTDQEGRGTVIAIPRGAVACPVEALRTWLIAADITAGPLFRVSFIA